MLTAYLVCLIVGGVLVGLSVFSGLGKDMDGHDGDAGGAGDGDGADHLVGDGPSSGAHAHPRESDSELTDSAQLGRPRPFVPFLSFRFWTFGSLIFGGSGLALTELAGLGEPFAALMALGAGLAGGTGAAALVRALRRPIGATAGRDHWRGRSGELVLPLAPGGLSKIHVATRQHSRDLVVALADPHGAPLPKGTRVVVVGFEDDGRALVAVDTALFDGDPGGIAADPVAPALEKKHASEEVDV